MICNFICGSQFVLVKATQDQIGPLFETVLLMFLILCEQMSRVRWISPVLASTALVTAADAREIKE